MSDVPTPPEPPRSTRPGSGSNQSSAGTWIALFGLILIGGALLGLGALVMPHILGLVAVVAVFGLTIAFHYLVWGWWMSQMKEEPPDEE